MRIPNDECWSAVRSAEHGVLCTTNAQGEIDAVPVCFAVVSELIVMPIDLVKQKGTTQLGRLKNLDREARATLLCERWSMDDWSQLWWVRVHLARRPFRDVSDLVQQECDGALRQKYAQYREAEFAELVVFDVIKFVGWSATSVAGAQWEETDPLM